jgi:hypothetical protein
MKKNGWVYAPVRIDESTEMPDVADQKEPLKLNMSAVKAINSYGTRRLLAFVRSWAPKRLEYHECSVTFVDAMSIVRDLLGPGRDPTCVKSLYVPLYCEPCDRTYEFLIDYDKVQRDAPRLGLPAQACSKCGRPLVFDLEVDEYFAFSDG